MNKPTYPDVSVYVCHRRIPEGGHLPRQWTQDGIRIRLAVLPCSGKTDTQYLFHAIEAGARGLVVVTCPRGECRLAQGNYRAELRVRTVRRLLAEIGMEPDRALLVRCAKGDDLEELVRDAVNRICALGESPIGHGPRPHRGEDSAASPVAVAELQTEVPMLDMAARNRQEAEKNLLAGAFRGGQP